MVKIRWEVPKKISLRRWLGLYVAALALNAAVVWRGQAQGWLPWNDGLWLTLIACVPALLLVSVALLLRYGWYQLWWVYQTTNEAVYERQVRLRQAYWAESVGVAQLLCRCGTLADAPALAKHLAADEDTRAQSLFATMSQQIPSLSLAASSIQAERSTLVATELATQLAQSGQVSADLAQVFWVWVGEAVQWSLFREAYVALGKACPQAPDQWASEASLLWAVDRVQEAPGQQVLVLGYTCTPDFELLLALLLTANGQEATLYRAFTAAQVVQNPSDLRDSLPVTVVSAQSVGLAAAEAQVLHERLGLRYVPSSAVLPSFLGQLPPAQQLWLLLLVASAHSVQEQVSVLLHWQQHIIPVCLSGLPDQTQS
ncbi:MAG: hypothetical protein KBC57_14410 [Neisseriaceae bacterium]|nr:hypothetical protein [Neisseriaceae bacterium]